MMIEIAYALMFTISEYNDNEEEIHNKIWQQCSVKHQEKEDTLSASTLKKNQTKKTYQASNHEVGIASYYASCFEGKSTACGELYCGKELTAAHKTLPFGTLVRVTMLSTGKQVTVKINDRGPYSHKRVIDLSYKAAQTIGLVRAGVSKVKLEVLKEKKNLALN